MQGASRSHHLTYTARLLVLSLLVALALIVASMGFSLLASASLTGQRAGTNGNIHIGGMATTNGNIYIGGMATTNGDIHVGEMAASVGDIHIGS